MTPRTHLPPARRSRFALAAATALALALGACGPASPEAPTDLSEPPPTAALPDAPTVDETDALTGTTGITSPGTAGADAAGLPNPASVYCVESGGELEIRTDPSGGQVGICVFPDGTECEEWALYRGECWPGQAGAQASKPGPAFASEDYGFTLTAPQGWRIDEERANHVIFRKGDYFLFVGFKHPDDDIETFRTGMPAGDFEDGGAALLLGQELPKRHLALDGNIKVVEYATNVGVGDLRLYAWLDGDPPAADYAALDIPDDVIAEADAIIGSFALVSGEAPELDLEPAGS